MVATLQKECLLTNARYILVKKLLPSALNTPASLIAARFEDTWTKLRVFELYKFGYEKLVFLDADMLIMRNMDELFDMSLPNDWIAANHACVCNLDGDVWAPKDWTKDNCAYTLLSKDSPPTPVPHSTDGNGIRTHTLLNSGLFILTPFKSQWESILEFLHSDMRVKSYMFPDQDFLADFFSGQWKSIGWQYNAIKTMRHWHENIWQDNKVKNVHYIVDKPWSKRVGEDCVAGYNGKDGITHKWWWAEYNKWLKEREGQGETDILDMMREAVAPPLDL